MLNLAFFHLKLLNSLGTDIHFWHHASFGRILIDKPTVIGHEASGTVEKVGENVKNFAVGKAFDFWIF